MFKLKHNTMKKTSVAIFLLGLLALPMAVFAFETKSGASVYVEKNQVVEGNFYAAGQSITIEGRVTGDVICAGQSITIKGKVDGDVICAGQSIIADGEIGGNLRVAGNTIFIGSKVARNVMSFGANITTDASSTVGWDMLVGGAMVETRGKIGRDLYGGASNLIVAGEIGKNIRMQIDDRALSASKKFNKDDKNNLPFKIAKGAKINGDVNYKGVYEANVEEGVKIKGKINHDVATVASKTKNKSGGWAMSKIISIFSAFVVGLVLVSFFKQPIKNISDKVLINYWAKIGWGVVLFFLTPIAFVLLLITIIGIPTALLTMTAWVMALYLGKVLAGIIIGKKILEKKYKDESMVWSMILGIFVLWLVCSIPFFGALVSMVAIWWAWGSVIMYLKKA